MEQTDSCQGVEEQKGVKEDKGNSQKTYMYNSQRLGEQGLEGQGQRV